MRADCASDSFLQLMLKIMIEAENISSTNDPSNNFFIMIVLNCVNRGLKIENKLLLLFTTSILKFNK